MNVAKLKKFCTSMAGASEHLYAHPVNVLAYQVGGKNFAYFKTSEPEQWRFSVRVTPERFLELTDTPGVKPAKYMARYHWVTIVDVNTFPQQYLIELVEWSYHQSFHSLSRRKRDAIACMQKTAD
jgi:predicted DNA-binding protein (MmcQ/YjbR family)